MRYEAVMKELCGIVFPSNGLNLTSLLGTVPLIHNLFTNYGFYKVFTWNDFIHDPTFYVTLFVNKESFTLLSITKAEMDYNSANVEKMLMEYCALFSRTVPNF